MADTDPITAREGAARWSGKMLASGRFALLQVSLALFFVLAVSGVVMIFACRDEKVLQCAFGLIGFATGQISTVFGFYLRGGAGE